MKIYSVHFNKPEYIELQKKSFEKFINFDYEFIVVNNAIDNDIKDNINQSSNKLNLRVIDCQNNIGGLSSESHQNSFNYIFQDVKDGDTIMIMDHDLFIINKFEKSYFENYDLVILPQPRGNVEYPWPGMIIFNNIKNINDISFKSGNIEGQNCDTGGMMFYYIKKYNPLLKKVSEKYPTSGDLLMSNIDDTFLHLVSGSGWNQNYNLQKKLDILKEKINL